MRTVDFLVSKSQKGIFVPHLLLSFTNVKVELHPGVSVQPEKNKSHEHIWHIVTENQEDLLVDSTFPVGFLQHRNTAVFSV